MLISPVIPIFGIETVLKGDVAILIIDEKTVNF